MKLIMTVLTLGACVALPIGPGPFAANPHNAGNNPNSTGQPNQSCQVTTTTPGNAVNAGGSAFNPGGVAGGVYAGQQPQNSSNPMSVAQYDVACFQQTP